MEAHVLAHQRQPEPRALGAAAFAGAGTAGEPFEDSVAVGLGHAFSGVFDDDPRVRTRVVGEGRRRGAGAHLLMAQEKLRILPLGGLGEIGKNMTVLEYDGRILIVDCGVRFPTAEMVGIDLVLPDFSCLRGRIDDIEGIVITHGHEDHLGGLPWMLRELGDGGELPPVFGAPLTMAMARSKLDLIQPPQPRSS